MSRQDGGRRDAAIDALAGRDYDTAGDEYVRAAWRTLADPREGVGPFDADERGWVGAGLRDLVTSAVCYRVAGLDARATHRGVEGVAVASDLVHGLEHPVQRACLREFVADCRAAGGLDGVAAAYDDAVEAYEAAAETIQSEAGGTGRELDPRRWATTPLFEAAAAPIEQVARGPANGEIAVEWADLHGSDPSAPGTFLAHRARFKRQRFPGLIDRVVEDGYLAAPRGTTEYGSDHHRCPDCGATDVNWVGDGVLCLRCSRPMERQ